MPKILCLVSFLPAEFLTELRNLIKPVIYSWYILDVTFDITS